MKVLEMDRGALFLVLHRIGLVLALFSILTISLANIIYYFAVKKETTSNNKNTAAASAMKRFLISLSTSRLKVADWKCMHRMGRWVFMVTVVGGSVVELLFLSFFQQYHVIFPYIPLLDHFLALPSLAAATLSGVSPSSCATATKMAKNSTSNRHHHHRSRCIPTWTRP